MKAKADYYQKKQDYLDQRSAREAELARKKLQLLDSQIEYYKVKAQALQTSNVSQGYSPNQMNYGIHTLMPSISTTLSQSNLALLTHPNQ